ncbi:hypothetical protein E6W39_10120 [Kitasatospora acidiphila]|uniref:Uncharacterized protein n=1 Tax=Kitasatospora acidiphila TaxID=2567942 RepID=A0A540W2J5_9ACTN|nr:hypothetical protein [Kitasatospora acidiphila]TQF02554.1 hypothetical protein E6W39_10120 [Kitasatospora acidiphila]
MLQVPQLRRLLRPRTAEGTAVLTVLTVLAVAMIAMAFAPVDDRPLVGGLLIGAAALAIAALLLALRLRRAAAHASWPPLPPAAAEPPGPWFTADSLADYPAEELAALVATLDEPPSPHQLEAAWVSATHGRDVVWLEHHFGLPGPIARTLVAAARRRIPAG